MKKTRTDQQLRKLAENRKVRHEGRKNAVMDEDPEGYPMYPPGEDIFDQSLVERELNPEDTSKPKVFNTLDDTGEADTAEDSGKDLDIPGAELDDEAEEIGSEDEENNHYSLGGDNHENLEEQRDDTAP